MNLFNILGNAIGTAAMYQLNQMSDPTVQIQKQIAEFQNQINSSISGQLALLTQNSLGANAGAGFGIGQMPDFASMMGGLGSFWNTAGMPGTMTATTPATAAPAQTYGASSQELAPNLSAKAENKGELITGLLDLTDIADGENLDKLNEGLPFTHTAEDQKKVYEIITKLKEDFKDVPPETFELLKKNGTKIKVISNDTPLENTDLFEAMDSKTAQKDQDDLIEKLKLVNEAEGFTKIDPSVIKRNIDLPIMTYIPTEGEQPKHEIKGIDIFRDQIAQESVVVTGKETMGKEMADILSNESKTNLFLKYLEKRKTEKKDDPKELAKTDKLMQLVNMYQAADSVPVQHNGKYYESGAYKTMKMWNKGEILSLYSGSDNKNALYLKEEVIGKEVPENDSGKVAVHELGHAVQDSLLKLTPNLGVKLMDKIKANYKANLEKDEDLESVDKTKDNEFITLYSSSSLGEYAAETTAAFFDPNKKELLKEIDPNQYNLLNALFNEFGRAKQLAMSGAGGLG